MRPTKTNAIKAFLTAMTEIDLSELYNYNMECQVNVAQDRGEKIDGEYQGVKWHGYSDGITTWKPIRIPYNASTEPSYQDSEMTYDLGLHAEGIGMTGWDWVNKISKWVAFDFDAIVGHSDKHTNKLSAEELKRVRDVACEIPWVTVRNSTSGKGLHLYVFVDDVPTQNHTEHAGLARSILAKLSSLTGYDFTSKVDIAGGNMWVWHRKMKGTDGLKLIKQGEILSDIPPNWRDHVKVVRGTSKKLSAPTDIEAVQEIQNKFDILAGQRIRIKLDEGHLALIRYLNERGYYHWWDADHHMLVTHTAHIKQAHADLGLLGLFETETKASSTHNCFLFPMRRGSWSVRRYSPGVKEHPSWDQDGAGWTRCYLNTEPTLASAANANGGIEDPAGGYHFPDGKGASTTAIALGANVKLPPKYEARSSSLKPHKDGRLVMQFSAEQSDHPSELEGWLRKGNNWVKIFATQKINTNETDSDNYDDLVRHIVENDSDTGWVINSDGKWIEEPLNHVKAALESMSIKRAEVTSIIGSSVLKPWSIVVRPFEVEYPGDRLWNRKAPQLRFVPSVGDMLTYPTWLNVLHHIGRSLDNDIEADPWCKKNGIKTGADYLKIWIASMIQFPAEPLPYLFIYGETQDTGKSTFHEALELLFHPGYYRADHALQNPSGFNGELEGAILCVVEETNLGKNKNAGERVKDWVTSRQISLHIKNLTPFMVTNTMHFVQCCQFRSFCPIFPGDTRITMIHVKDKPVHQIPKKILLRQLEKEAADFLGVITTLQIPESNSRLNLPVIVTSDKVSAEQDQRSPVHEFIDECCHKAPGRKIKLSDFYDRFMAWLDPNDRMNWSTKQKVSVAMPDWVVKGRVSNDASWYWGNISFDQPTSASDKTYVVVDNKLVLKEFSNV